MPNHLFQSTLFAGLAALFALALRNNAARARYWIWLAASLKFLVPFSLLTSLGSWVAPARVVPAAPLIAFSGGQASGLPLDRPEACPTVRLGFS